MFKKILAATMMCLSLMVPSAFASYEVTVQATAYNAYTGNLTASGTECVPYQTIAVDPDVIPLGSVVYVPGYGDMVAEDTGVSGYAIDIAMDSNSACYDFGVQTLTVTVY